MDWYRSVRSLPRFKGQGTQSSIFNGRMVKGHIVDLLLVVGDNVIAILEIKIYILPPDKIHTPPSVGHLLLPHFFLSRVSASRSNMFDLNHVHVWIKLFTHSS